MVMVTDKYKKTILFFIERIILF